MPDVRTYCPPAQLKHLMQSIIYNQELNVDNERVTAQYQSMHDYHLMIFYSDLKKNHKLYHALAYTVLWL